MKQEQREYIMYDQVESLLYCHRITVIYETDSHTSVSNRLVCEFEHKDVLTTVFLLGGIIHDSGMEDSKVVQSLGLSGNYSSQLHCVRIMTIYDDDIQSYLISNIYLYLQDRMSLHVN